MAPLDAIREALVNSFCHRDYTAPESNKIAIFKNQIEIWNPRDFPEGLTPMDFIKKEEQSILINPLIADVLYKSKEIEKWGSGLRRIYDECKLNKVKVEFKVLKSGFMIVFYMPEEKGAKSVSGDTNLYSDIKIKKLNVECIKANKRIISLNKKYGFIITSEDNKYVYMEKSFIDK